MAGSLKWILKNTYKEPNESIACLSVSLDDYINDPHPLSREKFPEAPEKNHGGGRLAQRLNQILEKFCRESNDYT